ncbi:zinc finger and BTB domain-containing protein 14-like [Ctenocephalides felis]|uniref:zinc finger and BTB domain-containing protein 14-like n=1 Tax=Ctenocephalides felis TaxID=7515 RepID=UPI000E6E33A5|nr:zinc finger and BTB domain-containing protein 14-like [Ctenocephalides felis]
MSHKTRVCFLYGSSVVYFDPLEDIGPPLTYMCPKCGEEFDDRVSLWQHVAKSCGKMPVLKYGRNGFTRRISVDADELIRNECAKCGRSYKSARYLARHEKYECENQPRLHQCHLCSYAAKRRSHLKSHTMRRHRNVVIQTI